MLKIVLPLGLALGGLGAGLGAGIALKPDPAANAETCAKGEGGHGETADAAHRAPAMPEAAQGDAAHGGPASAEARGAPAECAKTAGGHGAPHDGELDTVSFDKPFVVPLFDRETVVGMVVLSLSVEVAHGQGMQVETLQPKLRDGFLSAMFRHANSGGFAGSFTEGQKMADLKAALRAAAHTVMPGIGLGEVLVTEIVRQDV